MDAVAAQVGLALLVVFVVYLAILMSVRLAQRRCNTELMQRVAQDRAEALLKDVLTVAEYAQLDASGYLEVRSPSEPMRTYRVPRKPGRVAVAEGGVDVALLCIAPVDWLPPSDVVLAHKLMIEGDEQEYLRRANRRLLSVPNRLIPIRN
jgi:hypothetical protein